MTLNNLKNLEEKYKQDFNRALNLYETESSHEELINFLKNGSIVEKQVATLKLDGIYNEEEAKIFISNLVNCDGKIREAVSFRLKEFIKNTPKYYIDFPEIFLNAIVDINGNICRNVIEAIQELEAYPQFIENFCPKLIENTIQVANIVNAFDIQDGKYKINKQNFKLYWYLETIASFIEFIDEPTLIQIISLTINAQEYTIREKAAKILSKLKTSEITKELKANLTNDSNYYVRRFTN